MFDDFADVPEDVRDLGDDRVAPCSTVTGRARSAASDTELSYAVVYTVRDGKIVRGREYMNCEEALEAGAWAGVGMSHENVEIKATAPTLPEKWADRYGPRPPQTASRTPALRSSARQHPPTRALEKAGETSLA